MTSFLVRFTLQIFVPAVFAVSLFYFLRHLAIHDVVAALGSGFLGLKLAKQGHRNALRYLDDFEAGLAEKPPSAFVLRFATPFLASIPAAFLADAIDWHYGFFIPSLTGMGTGAVVFLLAYAAVRIDYGPLRTLFISGRFVHSFSQARRLAGRIGYADGFLFGGLKIPERMATSHFLTVGTTGSGKTVTIRLLLKDIASVLRKRQGTHAVVYDPKTNVLPVLRSLANSDIPIVDLHPFRTGSFAWDVAADVQTQRDIEAIANTLIPVERESGENRFFADAPRELLQAVLRGLMQVSPGNWTLRDAYLILTSQQHLKAMLEATPEGKALVPDYFDGGDPRVLANIRLSIRTRTLRYRTIAAASHNAAVAGRLISLRDWSQTGRGFLVLGTDKTEDSGIDALNRVIIQLLTKHWLLGADSPKAPRHFLVLDEVQSAGRIDALSQLLNEGREKGVSAIFGFQDVASIKNVYGPDATEALLGQFGHKAFLRLEGDSTAQWASRAVGEVEQFEYTYGTSTSRGSSTGGISNSTTTSINEARVRKAALMPSHFLTIPPTNSRNGLTGFYSSPEIGVWQHTYASQQLWDRDESATPLTSRDAVDEADIPLRPFDSADLQRLRLPEDAQPEPDDKSETPTESVGWDSINKTWLPPE